MKTHFRVKGTGGSTQCGLKFKFDRYGIIQNFQATYGPHKVTCLRCLRLMKRKLKRLTDVDLVHLYVNSLIGTSPEAIHFYVELQSDDEAGDLKIVEVLHPLTEAQTIELNTSDGEHMRPYRVGERYPGYWSYEDAKQVGIDQWRGIFPDGKFLVEGRSVYLEPKIVADSVFEDDGDLKAAAAQIVADCKAIGWFNYEKNDALMDQYTLQWETLL